MIWLLAPSGGFMAFHSPFQLGYLASSCARASPTVIVSAAARASIPVELRYDMIHAPPDHDGSQSRFEPALMQGRQNTYRSPHNRAQTLLWPQAALSNCNKSSENGIA